MFAKAQPDFRADFAAVFQNETILPRSRKAAHNHVRRLAVDLVDQAVKRGFLQRCLLYTSHNHKRNLECDRIFKNSKIESRALLQLIQPIDKGISVYIKLSRGFRDIQKMCIRDSSSSVRYLIPFSSTK